MLSWVEHRKSFITSGPDCFFADIIDNAAPAPQREANRKSSGNYEVTVKTSTGENTVTSAHTFITLYGTSGHSDKLSLETQGRGTGLFTPGEESKFQVIKHFLELI